MSYLNLSKLFDAEDIVYTATARATPECKHGTGWYVRVRFFWIFSKLVYVCSDCGGHWHGYRPKGDV